MGKRADEGMTTRAVALFIVVVVAVLLISFPVHARWQRPQDNKSVTELEGMSMDALFNEALDVCVARALLEPPAADGDPAALPTASETSAYLETIAHVVAQKDGGAVTPWMTKLLAARTGTQCQRGLHSFLAADTQEKAPRPRSRPPRQRLHQLPPWLAPR